MSSSMFYSYSGGISSILIIGTACNHYRRRGKDSFLAVDARRPLCGNSALQVIRKRRAKNALLGPATGAALFYSNVPMSVYRRFSAV
jgi:hypothetical protein